MTFIEAAKYFPIATHSLGQASVDTAESSKCNFDCILIFAVMCD